MTFESQGSKAVLHGVNLTLVSSGTSCLASKGWKVKLQVTTLTGPQSTWSQASY